MEKSLPKPPSLDRGQAVAELKNWLRRHAARLPMLRRAVQQVRAARLRQVASHAGHAVDRFPRSECGRLIRVAGWFLPEDPRDWRIELLLDGAPAVALQMVHRHDLGLAFPTHPQAVRGGFLGDLVVPESIPDGGQFRLTLRARGKDGQEQTLADETLTLRAKLGPVPRTRGLDLLSLLEETPPLSIAGVPHYHSADRLPVLRLDEPDATHPYGNLARDLIEAGGRVLDFGAGIQSEERLRDHVINLDAIHFPWVDIVCTRPRLPFREGIFDAVISQAVFEHIPDPFLAAKEIFRILKPGGRVLIDTAFMQPFHGDPDHYFNMTLSGLSRIMDGFEIQQSGIQPWQTPHWGLMMQIENVLPLMPPGTWRSRLEYALQLLKEEGGELDADLGEVGGEALAAGVYVLARKPE